MTWTISCRAPRSWLPLTPHDFLFEICRVIRGSIVVRAFQQLPGAPSERSNLLERLGMEGTFFLE
jgi:hypothetical protein